MRKLIFLLALLVMPMVLFAQDPPPAPESWLEVIGNFNLWWASLGGLSVLAMFVSGVLNGLLNIQKKFVKMLIAWIISILLAVIGNLANLGFLAEAAWSNTFIYGFGIGLVANGLYDVPTGLAIVKGLEKLIKRE